MRILVVGGTRFVGRHIVEAALAAGHDVTLFHRGHSGADLFPAADSRLGDRDRPEDLAALGGDAWDATIDTCAYVPRQVHALADAVGDRAGQHVNISSVSVYDAPRPGYDESAAVVRLPDPATEVITGETYGGLKVLCERAAVERFGAGTLVVRPTYVIGPHDVSWRFPWWVTRLARGGDVLAPGPASDPAQVIDARDMAAWIVAMVERGAGGVFHAVGPAQPITFGDLLATIATVVAPDGAHLEWVDEAFLLADGIDATMIPLWAGGEDHRGMAAADPSNALGAGLHLRPLSETVSDTHAWARDREPTRGTGLDADHEADLLARWHRRRR